MRTRGVVVLGAIMSILDITVVNVALPTFQTGFGTPTEPIAYSQVAWTVMAYTLALATDIPLTGWVADRFGTKRLYMVAVGLFTAGSVLCALATSIEMLIGFRVLQGLGGGMLMPLGMTIMTRAAGPHRMGRLMAILGVPMLLGPILGPILGGWVIEHASWHWIFLINLQIGLVALVYAAVVLPKDAPEPSESFDFVGLLMMSPGLALFLFGVSSLPADAGLLVAPQGLGAMLTMPIAGRLSDRMPVGRIVPVGLAVIVVGMFGLTQIAADTQVASSVGVAVMSVVLSNHLNDSPVIPGTEKVPGLQGGLTETAAGILSNTRPEVVAALKLPASVIADGLDQAAQAFADTYWVVWVLVVLTLVPALMLPRRHEVPHLEDEAVVPAPTMLH